MDAVTALGGIVLGAGLAWLASIHGARRAAADEHARWLREKRYEAWSNIFGLADRVLDAGHDDLTISRDLDRLMGQVAILGPKAVDNVMLDLLEAIIDAPRRMPGTELSNEARARLWNASLAAQVAVRAHLRSADS